MRLFNFILHYIQKDQFQDPHVKLKKEEATLYDGDKDLTDQGEIIHGFVESASRMFDRQKSGRVFAGISREDNTFAESLDQFLDGELQFLDFSRRIARELEKTMTGSTLATGGYMAIAHYEGSPRELLIVMIKQEEGYAVDPKTLELREAVHLDLSTINVGARLNLDAYAAGDDRPLSLVRGLKEVAKYFRTFMGVVDFKNPVEETNEFALIVNKYLRQHPSRYTDEQSEEVKRQIANHLRENQAEPISLLAVGGLVNPQNPQDFFDYANAEGVSAEFSGDPRAEGVKSWFRVRYKGNRLLIEFDRGLLNDTVHWNAEDQELVVNTETHPHLAAKLNEAAEQ